MSCTSASASATMTYNFHGSHEFEQFFDPNDIDVRCRILYHGINDSMLAFVTITLDGAAESSKHVVVECAIPDRANNVFDIELMQKSFNHLL